MTLMLAAYIVDQINTITVTILVVGIALLIINFVVFIERRAMAEHAAFHGIYSAAPAVMPSFKFPKLAALLICIGIAIPSKETTIYLVGAHIVKDIITDGAIKDYGTTESELLIAKLLSWGEQSRDLGLLLERSGINTTITAKR